MKKEIICIFVMTLLIVTVSPAVGMMNVFPSNNSLIEKTGAEDYMMTNWHGHQKLVASAGAAFDSFGFSVSIDEDYAIIGAHLDDDNGDGSGSAYIFKRDGTSWTEQAKLLASDGTEYDHFGCSVSIDGDYAIIGADDDDDNGDVSGSAYIFKRESTSWTEQAKLLASDGAEYDHFGQSVSIDGDYAIIGAFLDDDGNGDMSGSAYIFKRDGTTWNEQDKLLASDGATFDNFGYSVSIDGDYAIIGAIQDDDNGINSGSAYVFKRDGTSWTQEDKLIASDGAADDKFGWSVSIDGDYAIIGAYGDDSSRGSTYVFKRDGNAWNEQAKLLASDGAAFDRFGVSVSIDGDYAIIGAIHDDDNGGNSGSAYIFTRSGTTWTQQTKLVASDGTVGDYFGISVSLYGDYALIGAYADDDNGEDSGSAYIFINSSGNESPNKPTITGKTNGKNGTEYEYTLYAVDPDGDNVKYHIDWDDGNSDTTTFSSPGTNVKVKHTWSTQGTYIIKATAEDTNGLVGPEGTLTVTMPRNRATNNMLLLRLLEQFPILNRLLSLIK